MRLAVILCLACLLPGGLWGQWCASTGGAVTSASPYSTSLPDVTTLPVVVHVVYNATQDNISDAQIASQIAALNRDFRAENADLDNVTLPAFQAVIADMEIEFVLADTDPQGMPHPGIIRVATQENNIANSFDDLGRRKIAYTELGGSDAWSTQCYLNIWIGQFEDGIAGLGTYPGTVAAEEDGVYIAPDRFGTTGTVTPPYHLGRTAVHEVGHYLNLIHLWGTAAEAACTGDDGLADTPRQSNTYLDPMAPTCPGAPFSCNSFDMYMNFMTFANDPCVVMFTEDQKAVAQTTLLTQRSGLWDTSLNQCMVGTVAPVSDAAPLLEQLHFRAGGLEGSIRTGQSVTLQVADVNGRLYYSASAVRHTFTIATGHWPQGLYFVYLATATRKETHKIIVL